MPPKSLFVRFAIRESGDVCDSTEMFKYGPVWHPEQRNLCVTGYCAEIPGSIPDGGSTGGLIARPGRSSRFDDQHVCGLPIRWPGQTLLAVTFVTLAQM